MWARNAMLEGRKRKLERAAQQKKSLTSMVKSNISTVDDNTCSPNEDSIMTRKPIRTRRPRIPLIQSGYCAICNLPYNNVEDHVQSKKHQKLIGVDANYIALNGYIHSDVGIESLLSLTGIDAIGFDDFSSPKAKRRNMPRTRASSVVSEIAKPPTTLASENDFGHRLRSRKNINYMTPPLDDDSYQEKPDLEPPPLEYKEYRELRSSTRALAKLTAIQDTSEPEVWNSGRPKRACINRQKRISADERLVSDNKTYYKVEVLSNKLRSNDKEKGNNKQKGCKGNGSEKGLIVKFKKLRNSELTQLNTEATNFLFPKKDDSSDDDEDDEDEDDEDEGEDEADEDQEDRETEDETQMIPSENNEVSSSSELEDVKPQLQKIKIEDEASMDSNSSYCKAKKKRRSHAEAFIMDNQKYYKFETPGSSSYRLRYHGSYLSPVPTRSNGDCLTKVETNVETKIEKQRELKKEKTGRLKVSLDEFKFSFETVPENEKWYKTFRRQDRAEQIYQFSNNYHWDDFVMPYQIPHLKPMDPRICYSAYKDLLSELHKASTQSSSEEVSSNSDSNSGDNEVESSDHIDENAESVELLMEQTDEDSKLSGISLPSRCAVDDAVVSEPRKRTRRRRGKLLVSSPSGGRNPRKSPRQHASTLAILSSLIHQRKRRSRNQGTSDASTLQTVPEEPTAKVVIVEQKPTTPQRTRKKKVDYFAIAAQIDEELNSALIGNLDLDVEPTTEPDFISFKESRLNVDDIMKMYEESTAKENETSFRRFFNGAPGRKPGKRKKNKTGWPNKVKKRKRVKEGESESLNGDVDNMESNDDDDDDEDNEESDSIIDVEEKECNHDDRENKCDHDIVNRVENNSEIRDTILQPYVYVKKLDNFDQSSDMKVVKLPKRIVKRPQRRIINTSPKAPRMLRRSKGRWYRER